MKESTKITDRIKTFKDARKALGIWFSFTLIILTLCAIFSKEAKASLALFKLTIIIKALNEGWVPNWDDSSEGKYYPWFYFSGVGLSSYDYDYTHSYTNVGSRLVLKSGSLAEYSGTQFLPLYSDMMVVEKAA